MKGAWQSDWDVFVGLLGEQLRAGATTDELSVRFGSEAVAWTGVLAVKELDEPAPAVSIDLPEKQLDLGKGCSAKLNGFSMQVARHSIARWDRLEVSTLVTFTAKFEQPKALFAPIRVKFLKSGPILILLKLREAVPA